ncbi:MAG TPA: orotate phosphoribosyltransferase [Thermoplasmata archaeon]|nr:orotate phosphoribosyltransferase [Thermoplasmata archaeon]
MSAPAPPTPADPALLRMLKESGAVRFGRFTLASGRTSEVYVDIKLAWTEPARLALLGRLLSERVGGVDRLAGVELGAVPLLAATSLAARLPFSVIRRAAKAHGTHQRIEGEIPEGSLVLLIEDVTTSGGSVSEAVEVLRNAGGRVDRVLVVVDREEGARDRLASLGVRLESLATLAELRGPSP